MHDLLKIVILLGAAQGAVLAVLLAARPRDRLPNRILAALVGGLTLLLALGLLNEPGFAGHPHLLGLGKPLPFLFGPLLYLYIVALTRPASRFDRRWLVHGLPFAANLFYLLEAFYLRSGAEKLALARAQAEGHVFPALRLFEVLLSLQAMGYLAASWIALRRHARRIEGFFSDLSRIDLRWLKAMVLAHAAVWTLVIAASLLRLLLLLPQWLQGFDQAIRVGSALVVFLTGYMSLLQPELFKKAQAAQAAEPAPRPLPRYQRNRLEDEEARALAAKITARMQGDKLYRDSALTLQALADAVGATPHMVSQVLNLHIGKSFFALVNSYRAEELMAALTDPRLRDRGILELALDAGFNSKSTLNSFFKRYTGLTPSEFRRVRPAARTPRVSTG